jgi:Ni,Fe-hydrogenase III large subunit
VFAPRVVEVAADALPAALGEVLAAGGRVQSLFAAGTGREREVRCTATDRAGDLLFRAPAPEGVAASVIGVAPWLAWDEREARDVHGITFAGHEPHRALVAHPDALDAWTTPVVGDDVHQIAVGPVHAGVIESGHFRFHVVGERILLVDVRLFHKHRGLELAAEGLSPEDASAVVRRACAACSVTNAVAFAQAVEAARGRWPDDDLRRERTLLLELERLYNHLNDIGAMCAGIGFAAGTMLFAAFKERAQRVNRALAGHRFLFGAVAVGRSGLATDAAVAARARSAVAALAGEAMDTWHQVLFDPSVRDRVAGAGVLARDDALRLGTTGPAARASGVARDVREESPRLWYPGFAAASPPEPLGDVAARMEARAVELRDTFRIVDELLADPPGVGAAVREGPAGAFGTGRVESPRGETVCAVEVDGDAVRRVHLRTGSYANWPSVARAAQGGIVPDFPLVNKSFELCYACVDR